MSGHSSRLDYLVCLSIVPTLRVGMPLRTLRVRLFWDAERPWLHSHAERWNDHYAGPHPIR
ncbi:hypothetical protein B0E42_04520 [Pseudomonas sp. A25(2017)]|nr:hypothetical protein B0E42_04520 [Pseudomonas sp. A25(2017)]